ncbi:MAG: bifunctional [glutamine synthetase] adenylyltransferase/[glutamine synthetase]-adenylyl-L-tyrosine phosphorylase, partial [Propionibacteriaceae bacterium]|nr:bifunctional [glutamine synthetase] adenylyltransferase/[glutamine synthetase]-adenylyl-L-tyrosine phosphorylase [Propionibacteriaceae bacterium]
MDEARRRSMAGELARRGFSTHSSETIVELASRGFSETELKRLASASATVADPDFALSRLAELGIAILPDVAADERWLARVAAVMGGSRPLGRHLVLHNEALDPLRHPGELSPHLLGELRRDVWNAVLPSVRLAPIAKAEDAPVILADPKGVAAAALRVANRTQLARIAARDLTAYDPVAALPSIARELTDLADAIVEVALALVRGQVDGAEHVRLAVVALGKCGARELNYLSDVDVLYVAEPADDATTAEQAVHLGSEIAAALMRLTSANTAAGTIWSIDAALRPEGNAGPLARTMAAMAAYYDGHAGHGPGTAKPGAAIWEFQAMMKARPMAGDMALGQAFCDLVRPLVWTAGGHEGFVAESRAMRRRVVSLIPRDQSDREIKLGAGGLRDIEFSVQILQLVHGRGDEAIRLPATLEALAALTEHNYISSEDAAELDAAYRFERLLEHRQQLFRLRRTHLMPDEPGEMRRLARSMPGAESGEALWTAWRQTAGRVQRLQQRVFYSPLLEAVAKVPSGALRLSSDAAEQRLAALGFADPTAALRHIASLTQGVSRTAEITRHLMPAMLGWLADGANPDAGLLAFRQGSEALGRSPWYLKALRDESGTAENMA